MNTVHYGLYLAPLAIIIILLDRIIGIYFLSIIYICWLVYLAYNRKYHFLVCSTAFVILIGAMLYMPEPDEDIFLEHSEEQVSVSGKITRLMDKKPDQVTFLLKHTDSNKKYHVAVHHPLTEKEMKNLHHGARCQVELTLNENARATNPGEFDYRKHLQRQGISGSFVVSDKSEILCEGQSILAPVYEWRMQSLQYIDETFTENMASWMKALLLGDRSSLDKEIVEAFQHWGLAHLLAISGLHIGIMTALVYLIFVRFNFVTKETARWVLLFILPIYILLAGGTASVMRSVLTIVLLLGAEIINKRFVLSDIFSLVFLLLVFWDPYQIYDIGFQFSFLVTFGLILSAEWLTIESLFFRSLRLSYISQMVITPIQLHYFSIFQPLGILLNVFIVPLFSIIFLPLLIFSLVFSIIMPNMLIWLEMMFSFLESTIVRIIVLVDDLFPRKFIIGEIPLMLMFLYYLFLYFSMYHLEKKNRKRGILYAILLTATILFPSIKPHIDHKGLVTMLDVGQADTFVIELPKRQGVILYDVGATYNFHENKVSKRIYEQVVQPYLQHRQIDEIDTVFLSHEDLDHDGSLPFLLDDYPVNRIVVSPYYQPSQQIQSALKKHDVPIYKMYPNQKLSIGDYEFTAMGPLEKTDSANENSLVLQTNIGGYNWLLTGDIGKDTEKQLLKHYPSLQIDVLKIAHHGSKNSSSSLFIEKIDPSYGLISVGRNNRYGHPAEEVIQHLANQGVNILRTDLNGAIQFEFTKTSGTFIPYLSKAGRE